MRDIGFTQQNTGYPYLLETESRLTSQPPLSPSIPRDVCHVTESRMHKNIIPPSFVVLDQASWSFLLTYTNYVLKLPNHISKPQSLFCSTNSDITTTIRFNGALSYSKHSLPSKQSSVTPPVFWERYTAKVEHSKTLPDKRLTTIVQLGFCIYICTVSI